MIRNILFAILLTHSALVANGKSSRILLQTSTPATTSAGTASAGTTSIPGVTPAPITPAPVTSAPVTPAPITPAPVTPAPVTPAPVTPAPVTAAPVTAAPITAAPTTSEPTAKPTSFPTKNPTLNPTLNPTMAPLPSGFEYGAWGQVCPIPAGPRECAFGGIMRSVSSGNGQPGPAYCDGYGDCCLCSQIACGTPIGASPHGCETFHAGDFGAFGVGAITIIGDPSSGSRGAIIDCSGKQACGKSNIFGDSITYLLCNIDGSCQGATMQIDNPAEYFWLDCNGPESCKDLTIVINIGTPIPSGSMCNPQYNNIRRFGGIKCNNQNACNGMNIMINNRGCDHVILENLNCLQDGSCTNANFEFNGDIEIENCECGPSCGFATGLGKCFKNLDRMLCPDVRSCMNMQKTIINPMNLFYLECSNYLSCAGAYFTIDLEQSSNMLMIGEPVRVIESLKFGGVDSGRGAIIDIHNHQYIDPQSPGRGVQVIVRRLECSSQGSCQGLTIITGDNVIIEERICGTIESCQGCFIKKDANDIGIPCDPAPVIQQFIPGQVLPGQPGQFVPNQQPNILPGQPQQFTPQQQGPPQFLPFNPQQQQQPNILPGQPRV